MCIWKELFMATPNWAKPYCFGLVKINSQSSTFWKFINYRLIHGHFHIGLVIIPRPPYWPETQSRSNKGRGMITRPIWKCPCIKLFITYFRHLEKKHPYWASIWKWSCSNPITGYFPGMWTYGQFTSGHIGHTKMPLFELSM